MIQDMADFRWPRPLGTYPSRRDHSKKCAFHKEHGHTTETCRCLHYLVERLIKAGHLKQYLRSDVGSRDASRNHNSGAPRAPAAPKAVINYINRGPSDEEYNSKRKRQKLLRAASVRERVNSIRPGITEGGPRPIDGTIIFPPVDPTRILHPHRDALILSLEIGDFDVRRILVDPTAQPILYKHQSLATWDTVSEASKTLGESYPDSTGRQLRPWETLYYRSKLAQSLSKYNFQWYKIYHPSMSSWGAHGYTT